MRSLQSCRHCFVRISFSQLTSSMQMSCWDVGCLTLKHACFSVHSSTKVFKTGYIPVVLMCCKMLGCSCDVVRKSSSCLRTAAGVRQRSVKIGCLQMLTSKSCFKVITLLNAHSFAIMHSRHVFSAGDHACKCQTTSGMHISEVGLMVSRR